MFNVLRESSVGKSVSFLIITALIGSSLPLGSLSTAYAAVVMSDSFGSGSDDDNIDNWEEEGSDNDSSTLAESAENSGEDLYSPADGNDNGRFAKIGEDEWICREIDASGYSSMSLKYYWRGDGDAESDDFGIVEYRITGSDCNSSSGTWVTLAQHMLDDNSGSSQEPWSSLQSISLPSSLNNADFQIRFRNNSSQSDEYFRVDGVSVETSGDTTAPTVTNVTSSTANGSYNAGDVVNVQVTFSEVVLVTGTPRITLETGATDRNVNYTSGSNSNTLTFAYTVQAGDTSSDLDYTGTTALALNGGTIRDAASNNATLTLATPGAAGSLGANKVIVIDTTAPTLGEVTPVPTPTNDATPNYTFSSNETGTIAYAGGCTSGTSNAVNGNNTVTFASLADGMYSGCTVKVTDAAGNQSNTLAVSSFDVDTLAPVITINGANPLALGTGDTFVDDGASALDAHDGAVPANPTGSVNTAVPGTYNITYTATDAAGNSSSAIRAVNVSDDDAPMFSGVPSNMTVEATSLSGAVVSYTNPTANDNVDGDVSANVVCTPASGSTFAFGTTVVGCAVSDAAGNDAATSFNVTVEDTTDPILTMPVNQTLEATAPGGAVATFAVTANDNIDGDVSASIVCDANSGNMFALGVTTVSCTAEDTAGNSGSGSFTITVEDTTAPVITFDPNAVVVVTVSETESEAHYNATATDAGDAAPSLSCSPISGSMFPSGVTTVTCTATDASGNSATESTTVTVTTTPVTGGGTDVSPYETPAPSPETPGETPATPTEEPTAPTTPEEGSTPASEEGEVLGESCVQLTSYVGMGKDVPDDVRLVQEFLNKELGLTIEATGKFDSATKDAVKMFQLKYITDILEPWIPFGHDGKTPTGIVYKTTQYKINVLSCPGLEIAMPELP